MTVLAERASPRRPAPGALTRSLAWHPEWWVYAVAGAAALVLVAGALSSPDTGAAAGHHMHEGHHAMGQTPDVQGPWASWLSAWEHWALMVAAMMLPVVAPQVRRVATRSLWSRRHRAAVSFVLAYVACGSSSGAGLVAVVLALGGQEQLAPWLAVVLLTCGGLAGLRPATAHAPPLRLAPAGCCHTASPPTSTVRAPDCAPACVACSPADR